MSLTRAFAFVPALLIVGGLCHLAFGPAAVPLDQAVKQPKLRTWSDSTGKYKVEAEIVELENGKAVLRKQNGKTISVSLERFSEADQRYIRQYIISQRSQESKQPIGGAKTTPQAAEKTGAYPCQIKIADVKITSGKAVVTLDLEWRDAPHALTKRAVVVAWVFSPKDPVLPDPDVLALARSHPDCAGGFWCLDDDTAIDLRKSGRQTSPSLAIARIAGGPVAEDKGILCAAVFYDPTLLVSSPTLIEQAKRNVKQRLGDRADGHQGLAISGLDGAFGHFVRPIVGTACAVRRLGILHWSDSLKPWIPRCGLCSRGAVCGKPRWEHQDESAVGARLRPPYAAPSPLW